MTSRPEANRTRFGLAFLLGILLFVVVACSKGTPAANAPTTELTGTVTARADGFDSRPGWAEPGQAWSKTGETLIVVGHAKVAGDQRMEMAFRVSDSYARAELLRFLTVRVVAVLTDEEASGTGGLGAEDRRVLEERITTQAEALIDDWFVSARYWEKRKDGKGETLHVFSRLEVERAKVDELLRKSGGDGPDLRLTDQELSERLSARWGRMTEVTELNEAGNASLTGVEAPDWAAAGDSESDAGFTFVCQARAEDEETAEALARARCNEKLCRLFGVQITARTTVKENLQELTAESEVTEQCADVRAVGRKTTSKSSECTDEGCVYWVKQTYPRAAYLAELERQKEPTIIRQEVVVQEGDVRYRDPTACDQSLRSYAAVEGLSGAAYEARLKHLNAALKSCQGIDGRDSGLFASLNLLLTQRLFTFVFQEGTGEGLRSAFAVVKAGFSDQLLTERFLTTRIQMVRDVIRDAIFPMQLIDATEAERGKDDAAFEGLVRRVIEQPLGDQPVSKYHTHSPHAIMLGVYWTARRSSPTYRKFLISELDRKDISCDRPDRFDAEQVAGYFRYSDSVLDDDEYAALVRAFRHAPSSHMDRCLGHLLQFEHLSEPVRKKRLAELARLVIEGKLELTKYVKKDVTHPFSNTTLFAQVLSKAELEERLDLYLQYRTKLVASPEGLRHIARKVTGDAFGGLGRGILDDSRRRRSDEQTLADCRSLPKRYRPVQAQAPELVITDTDACECLRLPALESTARKSLVELWTSMSDRVCKHFTDEEWPGGNTVWPYETRRWKSPGGTPFRYIPRVLGPEIRKCADGGVRGVRYTPTLHATMEGRTLRKVTVQSQLTGNLRNMTKADDDGAIVTREDVQRAQKKFEACLAAAAEGYEVPADELEQVPTSPRRVWLEFGDQGVSHGYE